MTSTVSWRSPEGRAAVKSIVISRIPAWKDGLREQQEEPILAVLDGEDVLLCTATGDGKSALFLVPIICHQELSKRPQDFPNLPRIRKHPVVIIITPTKGLAGNIVETLMEHDVSALAYDRETIAQAHLGRRNLVDEIASCHFNAVCIDPEHLHNDDWCKIVAVPKFRDNLLSCDIDEAHLVGEWLSFRKHYGGIGAFLRSRLPPGTPAVALSATLEPGATQISLFKSLGFTASCKVFRFSNERKDIQFILERLDHGIKSRSFPQLLPYLNTGRKSIIFCPSYELVTTLFEYLLRCEPPGVDHGRRVRQYSSLCKPEFNAETLERARSDPEQQVIISTVALANGINVHGIDDTISIGMPSTLSQTEQQAGRAARAPEATGRAIVFVQKNDFTQANKFKAAIAAGAAATAAIPGARGGRKKGETVGMDPAKADLLQESLCLNAIRNERFQNPPLHETTLDCVAANRPLPCSLCIKRHNIQMPSFTPPDGFAKFVDPISIARVLVPRNRKLMKKEEPEVRQKIAAFGANVFEENLYKPEYVNRPPSWFFPPSLQMRLVTTILRIESPADLQSILDDAKWPFRTSRHQDTLWRLIEATRDEILRARPRPKPKAPTAVRGRKRARFSTYSEDDSDCDAGDAEEPEPTSSPPRSPSPLPQLPRPKPKPLLRNVTNRSTRSTRVPIPPPEKPNVKSLMDDMRPVQTNNRRRPRNEN